MNKYSAIYTSPFNPEVVRDLKKIDEQIKKEKENPEIDEDKMLRLRMEKLYRGMELGNGIGFNNNRRGIPY